MAVTGELSELEGVTRVDMDPVDVAAIPLAFAGLLNPLISGASMGLSSVCVVSNSLRLRRFHATSTYVIA